MKATVRLVALLLVLGLPAGALAHGDEDHDSGVTDEDAGMHDDDHCGANDGCTASHADGSSAGTIGWLALAGATVAFWRRR